MILEQLLEKKDLLIYLKYRLEHLKRKRDEAIYFAPSRIRERINQRFKGRISELEYLKKHILKLKETSKRYWLDCAKFET